jgi:hypothetical protein
VGNSLAASHSFSHHHIHSAIILFIQPESHSFSQFLIDSASIAFIQPPASHHSDRISIIQPASHSFGQPLIHSQIASQSFSQHRIHSVRFSFLSGSLIFIQLSKLQYYSSHLPANFHSSSQPFIHSHSLSFHQPASYSVSQPLTSFDPNEIKNLVINS